MSECAVKVGVKGLGCRRWGGDGGPLIQVRQLFLITLVLIFIVLKVKDISITGVITVIILVSCCSTTYRTEVS